MNTIMFYTKNHPMLFPKDCGVPFGALSNEQLRELTTQLTEHEKAHPHARYYQPEVRPLPEALKKTVQSGPMDASKAFEMKDYGKFMNNTGHCDIENGYCVLPSGVTYAAALIRQEGRTDDMVDYYNKHFADCDNLFYKIWHPKAHYFAYENGCMEDFGFGRMNMKFAGQVQVEDLGMSFEDIEKNDPDCIQINGTTAIGYNLDSPFPDRLERNTIVFYHRKTEYGREMRIRLWYGIGVENGRYLYTIPEPKRALNIAKCCMTHMLEEYTNDEILEKKFWEDSHSL
ncbi:MAG: hypothetical protein KHX56_00110 [Clostridiales bacterium]|nr:hypothetical protein [Clostridiales bacterium]